ncbi:thioredoxin domain-containing protein (plasmid) [Lactiplantibacillus pentosus]|uniref:Thioredoxin domain-containing protein n=1 Tax=Levilactobacillus namurensis TaxID=380393 RepID=A0AAW8W8W0_9LACO|nr:MULTISPECIES: thioredoxin domain-containing protein [Lactobacillaceae]MCW0154742.1 thioredoxin domain-containing protein [Lactiplantibacillus plantarum]MDT7015213.1 thioredoxin domain-containing protein [Levilactobacillus namurensis]
MTLIKKVSKALAVIVVILAVLGFAGHSYVNHVEKEKTVVTLAKHPKKVLFFYRDDCPDCQAIFHQIYWHNAISHNIILINMNQPKNRHYIQKYQLTAVPTLISGNQRYVGTKQSQIKRIVGD